MSEIKKLTDLLLKFRDERDWKQMINREPKPYSLTWI